VLADTEGNRFCIVDLGHRPADDQGQAAGDQAAGG
jgi:hypothetical protein